MTLDGAEAAKKPVLTPEPFGGETLRVLSIELSHNQIRMIKDISRKRTELVQSVIEQLKLEHSLKPSDPIIEGLQAIIAEPEHDFSIRAFVRPKSGTIFPDTPTDKQSARRNLQEGGLELVYAEEMQLVAPTPQWLDFLSPWNINPHPPIDGPDQFDEYDGYLVVYQGVEFSDRPRMKVKSSPELAAAIVGVIELVYPKDFPRPIYG